MCIAALLKVAAVRGWVIGFWIDPEDPGDDWPVVFAELPTGQVSWHIYRENFATLFSDLVEYPADRYDGHSTDEKYERLLSVDWAIRKQ